MLENALTFTEAARLFPTRPHRNTLRRWASKGFQGVKLRAFRVGNRLCTSKDAIQEFLAAINGVEASAIANSDPAHRAAEKKLAEMGL